MIGETIRKYYTRNDPPVLASVQSAHRNRKHALVVFGGMNGLESAVEADEQLQVPKEKTCTSNKCYNY